MSQVQIDLEEMKALFDMVVGSMDFGSGFLETDDVELLRRVAVLIGVDPWVATPSEFRASYAHQYLPPGVGNRRCKTCGWGADVLGHRLYRENSTRE